jgi:GR25 family glycosyltransferase involved in LPS biosynthesis
MNSFDNIYILYINQIELFNIRQKINKHFSYLTNIEFFKGFNGLHISNQLEYDTFFKKQCTKKKINKNITILTKGQYGHIKSFINIFQDALNKNYTKILILEPDVYFSYNLNNTLIKFNDIDYKLLYLGASQHYYYTEDTWKNINILDNFYRPYHTLGTFAIALDHSVLNSSINILSLFEQPSDVALCHIQQEFNNQSYVIYPNIICCNLVKSNTSGIRQQNFIQTKKNELHKWSTKYDFEDHFKFYILPKKKYKIIFDINSSLQFGCVKINNTLIQSGHLFISSNTTVIIILINIFLNFIDLQLIL